MKQLEYFLSCATLLNFRKAAVLHYVSPPTLTRNISALENELNISLFVRDPHVVKLTCPIDSAEALRKISKFTIEALPELFPVMGQSHMDEKAIAILPKTLVAGNASQLHRVDITGNPLFRQLYAVLEKGQYQPGYPAFSGYAPVKP